MKPTGEKNKKFRQTYSLALLSIALFVVALPIHWANLGEKGLYSQIRDISLLEITLAAVFSALFTLAYILISRRENVIYRKIIEQKEVSLLEKNEMLSVLMRSSATILFKVRIDQKFTLLFTSDNVNDILGYSTEEMYIPHFWLNHLHPEDVNRIFEEIPGVYATGFGRMQYRFKHKNGTWRWMQAEMKCVYDQAGNPAELLGNWWDITSEKEFLKALHVSNERFELAAKATTDVIYDWALTENTLWMSDAIFDSYGYLKSTNDLDLEWWEEKVHPADHDRIMNDIAYSLSRKDIKWSGNYRFRRGDGSYASVIDRAYISYDSVGKPKRWIGCMSDITTVKQTESDLKKALQQAEESTRAKSEFLANMSHEIRTPLNGILGMTELALETQLEPEQRRYMEIVKSSCDTLMTLINDILDFSKIDAGKLEISEAPFSFRDEMPQVLQPLGLRASLKKIEFVFSIDDGVPDLLIGDALRIQQIIANLVGNAIKFTEKGEVVLHIELNNSTAESVELKCTVTDTGIGIPSDKLKTIFQEFTQADGSMSRKYGGTGLGLSITKKLVELMGGHLRVESEVGKGSRFSFTLLLKKQLIATQNRRFTPLPILDNKPVLVVEDNMLSRNYIMHILENFRMKPFGVSTVDEGNQELIRALEAGQPYSLVILDLLLKGETDGYDVAEFIKNNESLKDTPIMVVTMSQKASDRERLAQIGVDKYFSKPFSQSDLLDCIQNLLARTEIVPKRRKEMLSHDKTVLSSSGIYHVLLVEDNLVNQEVAVSMLEKRGHRITIACNGEEAVQLYKKDVFDVILMDIQMPLLNGYEATARIRDHETTTGRHTLIIGLTANAMKGDREKCLEAGMDDYISKPVRMQELFALLDKVSKQTGNSTDDDPGSTINLATLIENFDGDVSIVKRVLKGFGNTALQQLSAIESYSHTGDANAVQMAAHSLKGQCLLVEMKKGTDLTCRIEEYAGKNDLESVKALLPQLKHYLTNGLEALEKKLQELETGTT